MLPNSANVRHGRRARRRAVREGGRRGADALPAGRPLGGRRARPRAQRGRERGGDGGRRSPRCAPAASRPRRARTRPGASRVGEAVGFVDEEIVAWGEAGPTLARRPRRARPTGPSSSPASPATARRSTTTEVAALAPDGVELELSRRRAARLLVAVRRLSDRRIRACAPRAFAATRRADRRDARGRARPLAAAVAPRRRSSTGSPPPAARRGRGARPQTVGDLLDHLPRDRRRGAHGRRAAARRDRDGARRGALDPTPPGAPARDEAARRGDRRRRDRRDEGDVLQPAVARPALPAGTRLVLHGKYQGRNRFRVSSTRRPRRSAAAGDAVAVYPASEGITSTQIIALGRAATAARSPTCVEPLPAATARRRAPARPARRARRRALRRPRGRAPAAGLRRAAARPARLLRLRRARRGASRRAALDDAAELTERWLRELLPFAPTGDQRAAMADVDADLAARRSRCSGC